MEEKNNLTRLSTSNAVDRFMEAAGSDAAASGKSGFEAEDYAEGEIKKYGSKAYEKTKHVVNAGAQKIYNVVRSPGVKKYVRGNRTNEETRTTHRFNFYTSGGEVRKRRANASDGKKLTSAGLTGKTVDSKHKENASPVAANLQGKNKSNSDDKFRFKTKGVSVNGEKDFRFKLKTDDVTEENQSGFNIMEQSSNIVSESSSSAGRTGTDIIKKIMELFKKLLMLMVSKFLIMLAPLLMIILVIWMIFMFFSSGNGCVPKVENGIIFDYLNGDVTLDEINDKYKIVDSAVNTVELFYEYVTEFIDENIEPDQIADTTEFFIGWDEVLHLYLALNEEHFGFIHFTLQKEELLYDFMKEHIELTCETEENRTYFSAKVNSISEIAEAEDVEYKDVMVNYERLMVYDVLYDEMAERIPDFNEYRQKDDLE